MDVGIPFCTDALESSYDAFVLRVILQVCVAKKCQGMQCVDLRGERQRGNDDGRNASWLSAQQTLDETLHDQFQMTKRFYDLSQSYVYPLRHVVRHGIYPPISKIHPYSTLGDSWAEDYDPKRIAYLEAHG